MANGRAPSHFGSVVRALLPLADAQVNRGSARFGADSLPCGEGGHGAAVRPGCAAAMPGRRSGWCKGVANVASIA